jgi:hypothetical protein
MKAKGASGQLHIPAAEACSDQPELNIKHTFIGIHDIQFWFLISMYTSCPLHNVCTDKAYYLYSRQFQSSANVLLLLEANKSNL